MKVAETEFRTEMSRVVHVASGKSFGYGELAAEAAGYSPSAHPKLKANGEYKLVGKPIARFDIAAKVNGATQYGIDAQVPGMCYGAIRISPVFGGKLVSVSDTAVAGNRGVKKVVRLDDAVVVVADRFWRARSAVDALAPVFDPGVNGGVSSKTIHDEQLEALKNEK
jgi:isoquinoline 1-oxidoreductase beta subunit